MIPVNPSDDTEGDWENQTRASLGRGYENFIGSDLRRLPVAA